MIAAKQKEEEVELSFEEKKIKNLELEVFFYFL